MRRLPVFYQISTNMSKKGDSNVLFIFNRQEIVSYTHKENQMPGNIETLTNVECDTSGIMLMAFFRQSRNNSILGRMTNAVDMCT